MEIIRKHPEDKPLFLYLPFQNTHAPLQAPQEFIEWFEKIKDLKRRTYAAMVTTLDDAIGKVGELFLGGNDGMGFYE